MPDSEAKLNRICYRCRRNGVPSEPVNRFAAIGKRMPKRKYEQYAPMPWQVADACAAAQAGE